MKRFNSYLLTSIFLGLAEVIADGVAHSISLDTIAAYATYFTIRDISRSFSMLCQYTYRITRKNEGKMLCTSMILSTLIGLFVWLLRIPISNLFELSVGQREIVLRLLNILPFSIFSVTLVDSVFDMLRLKDKLKLHNIFCVYFYMVMFIGYYMAYIKKDITYAIWGIIAADVSSSFIILYIEKVKLRLPDKGVFHDIKVYGIPVCTERFINQVNVFVSNIFASRMGNYEYTLFSVCNSVNGNLELITNAYYNVLMIEVPIDKPFKRQYQIATTLRKKAYIEIICLRVVLGFGYLLMLHGKVPLTDCFPVILIYILPTTPLVLYETYKVLCLVSKSSNVLMIGGIVACIVRILLCFICYRFSIAIWLFGLIVPAKFMTYVICERYFLKKEGYST